MSEIVTKPRINTPLISYSAAQTNLSSSTYTKIQKRLMANINMKRIQVALIAIFLLLCNLGVQAGRTESSGDTPITIGMGTGGAPLTSTINFPNVSGTITKATVALDFDVITCGADSLTLSGPGGNITLMTGVNHNAGNIFAIVDQGAFVSMDGECLSGCGSPGSPATGYPEVGTLDVFNGQTANAAPWTLTLDTFDGDCGPWTINSWSVILDGVDAVPIVTAPADLIITATGTTTVVNLGTATVTDDYDIGLTASADKTGPFTVGVHTVTWSSVADSGGNVGSATQTVTIRTVPDAPAIGTGTAGNTTATIAFTPPASDGSSAITGYVASCGAGTNGTGTASPLTVSGLTNGTIYNCSVVATNVVGSSPASATVSVTPAVPYSPPAPPPTSTQTTQTGDIITTVKGTGYGVNISQFKLVQKSDDSVSGIIYPLGVISFKVSVPVNGGTINVDVSFNQVLPENGFFLYKIDAQGNSVLIPDSFWRQSGSSTITLTLTDGGPFDLDGLANGVIIDPIAVGESQIDTLEEFTFTNFSHVGLNQWVSSEIVTIKGIQQMTAVSIEGGLLSIDGGNYQAGPIEIGLGQTLQILLRASDTPETTSTATVTVGDYQTDFNLTSATEALNDLFQYGQGCLDGDVAELTKAYIAYYNSPSTTAANNYWSCEIEQLGGTIADILTDFTNTSAFSERFNSLSDEQMVDNIYEQLFNRQPEIESKDYWTDTLTNGSQIRQTLPLTILESATGDDLVIINNKIAVAEYFEEQYGKNAFDTQNYANLLNQVTTQSSTVDAVKALIDNQVNLMITAKIPQIITEVNTTPIETNNNYVNYFLLQTNKIRNIDLSVAYKTIDGTAKAGKDYIDINGRATIKAGQLYTAIPVTIMGDYIPEDEEYYYLKISDPQGANFDNNVTEIKTKRTIIDDD